MGLGWPFSPARTDHLIEGVLMVLFSRLTVLVPATLTFLLFGLLVCMACGVTYAVVPLIRPQAIGSVSGIVGAGGNFGAVLAAMLFKSESLSGANAFFILGSIVAATSLCAWSLRFGEDRVRPPKSKQCRFSLLRMISVHESEPSG